MNKILYPFFFGYFFLISKLFRYMHKAHYLHIMHNDKFTKDIITMINKNLDFKEHIFIIYGGYSKNQFPHPNNSNVFVIQNKQTLNKIKYQNFNKIILHGLFNHKTITFLYNNKKILNKCYWIIWGGDLWEVQQRTDTKENINKRIDVIKNVHGLLTHISKDIDLAKKWCNAKGKRYNFFILPSNCYKNYGDNIFNPIEKSKVTILLNHSAAETGNHLQLLDSLKPFRKQIKKIICPLSYCNDDNYAQKVIKKGKTIFDNNFYPMTDYMNINDYFKLLLQEVDIGIFGHKRQQAHGNISALLSMGKKVYLNQESTLIDVFKSRNIKIYFTQNLSKDKDLLEFNPIIAKNNIDQMKKNFSYETAVSNWKKFLKS